MRKFFMVLVGLLVLLVAMRLGWPWPIFIIPGGIFLLSFRMPENSIPSRRTVRFMAAFVFVALSAAYGIGELLYAIDEGRIGAGEPGRVFEFIFGTDLLKVFWAALGGILVAAMLFLYLLVPFAYLAAMNKYGDYEQYKGHEGEATRAVLADLLGISQGTWMVRNGKAEVLQKSAGALARFGGPGILIVQQGHAVILEISGKISRVVHSGITWLRPFERVSMVCSLRTRAEHVVVEEVATSDKVLLEEFEFWVFHKLCTGDTELCQVDGPFIYNEDILINKVWGPSGVDWRQTMESISARVARDVVGQHTLEELVPMSAEFRQQFVRKLQDGINKITEHAIGVSAVAVDCGRVAVPPEAEQQLLRVRLAEWAVQVARFNQVEAEMRGEAEAAVLRSIENARAGAQYKMIEAIRRSFDMDVEAKTESEARAQQAALRSLIVQLRYIEALEKMADDSAGQILFPYPMLLSDIVDGPDGGDRGMVRTTLNAALERWQQARSGSKGENPTPKDTD